MYSTPNHDSEPAHSTPDPARIHAHSVAASLNPLSTDTIEVGLASESNARRRRTISSPAQPSPSLSQKKKENLPLHPSRQFVRVYAREATSAVHHNDITATKPTRKPLDALSNTVHASRAPSSNVQRSNIASTRSIFNIQR
ncbi:hypothetical protein EW146_g7702 [Bondarzewia mesenterica]|uniref:Uncharacterized protein n=1 Tax=Bondarzewia mesenterica TaxID=1095465 RepID=A0A4V3XE61_9AGAM|nr:hypothetical protein EW146_g7702 [Bondarzewia mesenterica]